MTASEWFARPGLLMVVLAPLCVRLALTLWRAPPREPFAAPAALAALVGRRRGRAGSVALRAAAWVLLALGAAGPRFGAGEPDGVARGRDLVVVVDLSGSMLAADTDGPARWQTAVRAARTLAGWLRADPGNRVAVVAFAARPSVAVPLTADADHLELALDELDGENPPPATRALPGDASGTRLGGAIASAAGLCDPGLGGLDIVVVSDGDDPAGDREWAKGVTAARAVGAPVHAVGVGAAAPTPLTRRGEPVTREAGGVRSAVTTRLHADLLAELAAEGRGEYLDAGQRTPDLAAFARDLARRGAARELTGGATPTRRDRAAWFLIAAALCWALGRR